jgi:hypothetical protein
MESQDKINNDNQCLFCLEENARTITNLACSCKILAHSNCWNTYEIKKGCLECPICHTITEESPLQMAMKRNLQQSVILRIHSHNDESNNGFQKGCILCCLGYFCLCGILSAVFG